MALKTADAKKKAEPANTEVDERNPPPAEDTTPPAEDTTPPAEVQAELVDDGADDGAAASPSTPDDNKKEPAPVPAKAQTQALTPISDVKSMNELRDVCVRDFGTYDRLKAGQGDIVDQDDNSLGKWVELEVYSFNSRFTVSPNDDDAESELCKFSLDNKVLDDDQSITVADYLTELKKDWPKAHSKEYFEVVGLLLDADKTDETELIDLLIQVQLSPTSRKSFENHGDQMIFKVARGKMDNKDIPFVKFTATPKKGNGKKWTMLKSTKAVAREAVE